MRAGPLAFLVVLAPVLATAPLACERHSDDDPPLPGTTGDRPSTGDEKRIGGGPTDQPEPRDWTGSREGAGLASQPDAGASSMTDAPAEGPDAKADAKK